jgi:hypothetical protein
MVDLVRELALAHHFGFHNVATLVGDDLLHAFAQAHHFFITRGGVNNENHFVSSFVQNHSSNQGTKAGEKG